MRYIHPKRRHASGLWNLLIGSSMTVLAVMPAQAICPDLPGEPVVATEDGKAPPKDPTARALWNADAARKAGREIAADAAYRRLLSTPPEKHQIARRAALRLAQAALLAKDYDGARALVARAGKPGADPRLFRQAQRQRAIIDRAEAIDHARNALTGVDDLRSAGAPADLLVPRYQQLLTLSCPYPDDYRVRIHLRLADTSLRARDFAAVDVALANAEAEISELAGPDQASFLQEIAQRHIDVKAEGVLAQAEPLEEKAPADARKLLENVIAMSPPPSPRYVERSRFRLANLMGQAGEFDAAAAQLAAARAALIANDADAAARLEREQTKLGQRRTDAAARARLALADQQRRKWPKRAMAVYREVIVQEPSVSPDIRNGARLSLASTLRQERFYPESAAEIALVSGAATSPTLIERAEQQGDRLELANPEDAFSGEISSGVYYDSNTPAIVSALRNDINDDGFSNDQRFDDAGAQIGTRLRYRRKLSNRYDYWLTGFTGTQTIQSKLNRLDRTIVNLVTGPVFNLPKRRLALSVAGFYNGERRGGHFLQESYGLTFGGQWRFDPLLEVGLFYSIGHRNDRRPDLDATNHDIQLWLSAQFPFGTLTPQLRVQRRNAAAATLDTWRYSAEIAYDLQWGNRAPWLFGFTVAPEYNRIVYRRDRLTGFRRKDTRLDITSRLWARLRDRYEFALDYRYLDTDSDNPSGRRLPNHHLGLNVKWLF